MAFLNMALFCLVFGSSEPSPTSTSTDSPVELHMKTGDNVLLTCQYQKLEEMKALEWTRSDVCVFFYRENRPYPNFQPGAYKGRVQLANSQMTNGNISVILGNVTQEDTGIYQCKIGVGEISKNLCSINLTVEPPEDPTDEPKQEGRINLGLVVGLPVAVVLLVAAFAAVAVWLRGSGNHVL